MGTDGPVERDPLPPSMGPGTGAGPRWTEEQLLALIEQAPDGIGVSDPAGRYIQVNETLCRMLGYSREELLGRRVDDLLPPRDAPRLQEQREAIRMPGVVQISEWLMRRKDGTWLPVEVSASTLPDGRRQGFVRDIRDRKRLEEEREQALSQLHAVLTQCPVGIVVVSGSGPNTQVIRNPRAVQLTGRGNEPYRFEGPIPFLERPDGSPLLVADSPLEHARLGQRVEPTDLVAIRPDGTRVPVVVRGSPLRAPDGRLHGGILTIEDVSAERELERLRAEWTSIVAHDLQQPVAALRLHAALLDRVAARDPEAADPVAQVNEIARILSRRMADLLDLSRAEVGQLPLLRASVDLSDLAQAAVERLGLQAKVDIAVEGPVPRVLADPDRIGQVLDNLLDNAVKYGTRDALVLVRIAPGGPAGAAGVSVAVENRGPGIAAADLPRLFQRFVRAAPADTVSGAGLGLHIARELCIAHGGNLTAESTPGETTTFRFSLPVG